MRRYTIWEGKDKIKYLRVEVQFLVCGMWCVRKNEKNTSVRRKTIESPVIFLSSFFVSVLSEKTQSKNESIRVRQNKYIITYMDRFQPYSKTWQNKTSFDQSRVRTRDLRIMNRITFPLHQQTK